ncbi:MAG: MarR family transcriptional regulator [Nevskia sp.]|nr:MarR family transcriptional regulator [Nevskia sp.]
MSKPMNKAQKTHKPGEGRDAGSFDAVERRIEFTRKRLRGYPHERVKLARLIAHLQKRQADMANAALKRYDLNYVTYTALMMMYGTEAQTLTPSDLRDATGEKPANVTRICDELVAAGLIERSASTADRRCVALRLTRKGEALVERFQPDLWQTMEQLYGGLSAAELRQVTDLLRRPLQRAEQGA